MASLCYADSKVATKGAEIEVSEEDENDFEDEATRFIDDLLTRVADAKQESSA